VVVWPVASELATISRQVSQESMMDILIALFPKAWRAKIDQDQDLAAVASECHPSCLLNVCMVGMFTTLIGATFSRGVAPWSWRDQPPS
jgi:hypothetical protein